MTTLKELEGKEVYLRPTGNNSNKYSPKIIKATIVKVARVNVEFLIDGCKNTYKYKFNGMRIESGHNSGYVVYESAEALDNYLMVKDIARKITDSYRYQSDFERLSIDKITAIAEILEV